MPFLEELSAVPAQQTRAAQPEVEAWQHQHFLEQGEGQTELALGTYLQLKQGVCKKREGWGSGKHLTSTAEEGIRTAATDPLGEAPQVIKMQFWLLENAP